MLRWAGRTRGWRRRAAVAIGAMTGCYQGTAGGPPFEDPTAAMGDAGPPTTATGFDDGDDGGDRSDGSDRSDADDTGGDATPTGGTANGDDALGDDDGPGTGGAATGDGDSGGPYPSDPFGTDPEVLVIQDGIDHVEGPTWVPEEQGFVYHTRPNVHRLWRIGEDDTSAWYTLPGGNHGSHYHDGWVWLANRKPGEIARIRVSDLNYESMPVAIGNQTLALPNDLDMFADGSIYFTDWGGADTPSNYIGFGVYRRHENGDLDTMIDDLDTPNGLAFTGDCQTLFVTDNPVIFRYAVATDGSLGEGEAHFSINNMNGIAVDVHDNVYTVGEHKVTAVDMDGAVVGQLDVGDDVIPVNLAFGGPDHQTLLITTTDGVLATHTMIPGAECNGL